MLLGRITIPAIPIAALAPSSAASSIRSGPTLDIRAGEMPAVRDQLLLVTRLEVLQFRLGPKAQHAAHPAWPGDGDVQPRWTGTEDAHGLVPADEQP